MHLSKPLSKAFKALPFIMLFTRSKIFYTYILLHLSLVKLMFVEAYGMNPRANHPDGRLPSVKKAKMKLQSVQDTIHMNHGKNTLFILVDGNNVRNSFGYESVTAGDLTTRCADWSSRDERTHVIMFVIWDGGKTPSCMPVSVRNESTHSQTHTIFSGMNENADDFIVSCCAFLSKLEHQVVIFTSDANLANRCKMQLDKSLVFHSIFLCLLLAASDEEVFEDRFAAEWEREERRSSVLNLQIMLEETTKNDPTSSACIDTISVVSELSEWINIGRPGLQIGRVTKGGSVLYDME